MILPIGINNLATVIQHILGMGGSTAVLFFVIAMAKPDALRWGRPLLYSCAAFGSALLVVFFALTPRPEETHNFFEANLGQPMGTAYCLTFLGYLTIAMTIASWLFLSYGRRAAGTSLRVGLRLLGAGTAFGALYTGWRIGHMTTRLAGIPFVTDDDTAQFVADLVEYASIALIILGNSVPAVGVLWRTITYRRALTEVRPLWAWLIEAAPGVVLDEPVGRSPRLQLHRQLIEIWDVVLILRAHASTDLIAAARREAEAARLDPQATDRLAEAMWIRAAWLAAVQGAEPRTDESEATAAEMDTDFDAEVRNVLGLARAFRDPRTTAFAHQHQEQPA